MMKEIAKAILWEIFFNIIFLICIYYLWNWIMPNLMMAKKITFLQAWGIRSLAQFCVYHISHTKNENSNL